jgi:hypothetical protein
MTSTRLGRVLGVGAMLACAFAVSGCAFSTTAKRWNDRLGPNDKPVFYKSTTKVGLNLLIAIPFFGDMSIDGLVDDLTAAIKEEAGDSVRIVQGTSENYWYGFPPFTWGVTPVISTVGAEYVPGPEALAAEKAAEAAGETKAKWYKPWSW